MAADEIFIPLDGGAEDGVVLAAGQAYAEAIGGAARAVFVGHDETAALLLAGDAFAGAGAGAVAAQALREERARGLERARSAAAALGLTMTEHAGPRRQATAGARLAAAAVVGPAAARGESALSDVFDALLFEDGAPILAPRGPTPAKRVAVAWDGSREAARALKAAAPFIAVAEEVVLLQAEDGLDARDAHAADPAGVERWLSRRAVMCRRAPVAAGAGEAGTRILAAAAQADCGLIVAGAFGHARLREAVFGGVTRALLQADSPSVFLAH